MILSLCPVAAFLGDLWNWTPGAAACALLAPALLAAAVRLEPRSLAVVAVLALRAMGEWREINDRERAGHAPR